VLLRLEIAQAGAGYLMRGQNRRFLKVSETFDYIVIGSGSAGSLMANRLWPIRQQPRDRGGPVGPEWPVNIKTAMPVGNIFLIPRLRYNWKHTLSGNAQIGGRSINFPRGKLMGGCSAINGGVYIRGQREDYDAWVRAGNVGWGYGDVLSAFMAVENYAGADKPWHGKGGELDVQKPRSFNPITHAIIAAAQGGHQRNDDFAGKNRPVSAPMTSTSDAARLSSARAFLNPVLKRPNLTVLSETMARHPVRPGRAAGIEIEQGGAANPDRPARGGAVRRGDQLAAIADAFGHRPGGHLRERASRCCMICRAWARIFRIIRPSMSRWRTPAGILCALAAHLWPYPAQPLALPVAPGWHAGQQCCGMRRLSLHRRQRAARYPDHLSGRAQGQCARHPLRTWLYGADPTAAPKSEGSVRWPATGPPTSR
jgi:hypothetical protein